MPAVDSMLSRLKKLINLRSAIFAIFFAATLFLLHHLLHCSLPALWLTANAIVFLVWRLSATELTVAAAAADDDEPSFFASPEAEAQSNCASDDLSMEATRRPALTKSETWERPRRRQEVELKKSTTFKEKSAKDKELGGREEVGWRRREMLVVGREELFRRGETLIKKHHDHLRLQRQESDQRRLLERAGRSTNL